MPATSQPPQTPPPQLGVVMLAAVSSGLLLLLSATLVLKSSPPKPAAHPEFAAMEVGGPIGDSDAATPWLGGLFGVLVVVQLSSCLLVAAGADSGLRTAVLLGAALYVLVFLLMFGLYVVDASNDAAPTWIGFPRATVVMIVALWGAPAVFTAIYSAGFHRWFAPASGRSAESATPSA